MSNKLNIFNSLPQDFSDDEEDTRQTKKVTGTRTTDKQTKGKGPAPQKEEHTRTKETRKEKGVTDKPHPLDRHSGAGNQAYGGKPKKGGAGKGNWGKTTVEGETPVDVAEEETEVQQAEEEKPTLTLQEYYEKHRLAEEDQAVNEAKAKITSDHLLKELGKATALKSREANDDKRVGKKKGHLDINHHAGISTEHADLLGFRTGFIEKEYRQRKEGEELPPRRTGGQREPREPREPRKEREDNKEQETPVQATPVEGEQPVVEGQATEGQERRREAGPRRGDGNRGGRGGNRGGNQGPRKPYVPRENNQAKINISDESAFPKLG